MRQPLGLNPRHLVIFFSLTLMLGVVAFTRSPWGGLLAVVLLQMAWFSRCVVGSGRVAHLPISRERLFRHAVVPGLSLLAATAVADEMLAKGVDAIAVQLDATDVDSIAAAADVAEARFGSIDVVANNVGVVQSRELLDATDA